MPVAERKIGTGIDPVRAARVDLAAAHRLANHFGFDSGIWNHFTLTVPGATSRFLVKAHGLLMSEISASNLIVVDAAGTVVEGEGIVETSAFCIHSKIHELHPNAHCVLHAHPPYCTWLADLKDGRVEMVDQVSLRFYDRVAYDEDYGGLAFDLAEGERIARTMGDKPILISRSHGVTVTGASVSLAFDDLYYLEQACARQFRIDASGREAEMVPKAVLERLDNGFDDEYRAEAAQLYFDALKRMLDSALPGYDA